jgi:putative transposase
MLEGCSRHCLFVHAYVILDNHFHLLATPSQEGTLSEVMKAVTGTYTQWFNCKYQRTGTLWEGRYWAAQVDSEHYLMTCSSYIELNPVRAGKVEAPDAYPWSSYLHNAFSAGDPLITEHDAYLRLGSTAPEQKRAYRRLVQAGIDRETATYIRESTRTSTAISERGLLEWHGDRPVECAN